MLNNVTEGMMHLLCTISPSLMRAFLLNIVTIDERRGGSNEQRHPCTKGS